MISPEEYRQALDLQRRGWSIARISRQLGRDRKTVRSYLSGKRAPGRRIPAGDDFLRFLPYCRRRLTEDPHLAATVLFAELVGLGYPGAYSTFTRALRSHDARPPCGQCRDAGDAGSGASAAAQPAGRIRFTWLRLPEPPTAWGCEDRAHLLLGSLGPSGRWRGALAQGEGLPHLVEAMDQVMRRLGGTAGRWCFDRLPEPCCAPDGRATPEFRRVARYYGAQLEIRPRDGAPPPAGAGPGRATRSWWSAVTDGTSLPDAQDALDRIAERMDHRSREAAHPGAGDDARPRADPLRALPDAPFPLWIRTRRTVTAQGLVPFGGNLYAVAHHLAGAVLVVGRRIDQSHLSIATTAGAVLARYPLAPAGAGRTVVERRSVVLERRPGPSAEVPHCRRSTPRPPSEEALAEAAALRAQIAGRPACRLGNAPGNPTGRVPPPRDGSADGGRT